MLKKIGGVLVAIAPMSAFAVPPDFTALTSGIDLSTVQAASLTALVPAHVSTCEMPSFDFFGNQMTMAGACDLIEGQRALLSTLFSAMWGISALMIVLRA